ncbi:MAG: ankyrin repeat domain-containing protein [Sphingobacteriia bacterium]|nr:ankyrin repeat domain-containing protein [Sphingobacteriia bacterium]
MTKAQSNKPKKYLILTSSGGGGHVAAAKAKKEELLKRGIPEDQIDVIDITGIDSIAANKGHSWIPVIKGPFSGTELFSGEANIKKWDELQKKGGMTAVRELEHLLDFQWIAERIQYNSIYSNMKKYLEENNVQEIFDTQALSTSATCQAITEHNKTRPEAEKLGMTKIVTEFLTHRATHFLVPLSSVKSEHREVLKVQVVKPPLLGPGENWESFAKRHYVEGITFEFLSEQGIEPPIRKEFKEENYNQSKQIIIKGKNDAQVEASNQGKDPSKQELKEQEHILQILGNSAKNEGNDFTITKGEKDRLTTITLGSQGSSTILKYVDSFIDQALKANYQDGNVYLCVAAGKNEGNNSLYAMVRNHIQQRLEDLEKQGKRLPDNVKIIPLAFQDGKHMASLHHNSDVLITRSGGMSSIEAEYTQAKNSKRKVFVHSEEVVKIPETFPNHNYDAVYESLLSGALRWEGGNAEYLMKNIGASLVSPEVINFGLEAEIQQNHLNSLFHMAYNDELGYQNKEAIKKLIFNGSNPNLKLPDGSSIIDHAKDFKTIKMLVSHGAKLTDKVLNKDLLTATQKEELKTEANLFKQNFVNTSTHIHEAFLNAIKEGNISEVKGLIHNFPKLGHQELNIAGKTYVSPVQYAIENNKLDVLEVLLQKKEYDVNFSNKLGTALHFAVEKNNVKAAELLLKYEANAHIAHKGKTPYEMLEGKPKEYGDMLKLFVRENVLHPIHDKLPVVAGVTVKELEEIMFHEGNKFGNTELHRAIHYLNQGKDKFKEVFGNRELIDIIHDNINHINQHNIDKKTPLSICNDQEVRKALVEFGADIKFSPSGLTVNQKGELVGEFVKYQKFIANSRKFLLEEFKNNKEDANRFTESLVGKLEGFLEKDNKKLGQQDKEKLCDYLKEAHKKLSEARTEVKKMSIIGKIANFFKKLIGNDMFTKFMKSASKNLEQNFYKEIKVNITDKKPVLGTFTRNVNNKADIGKGRID